MLLSGTRSTATKRRTLSIGPLATSSSRSLRASSRLLLRVSRLGLSGMSCKRVVPTPSRLGQQICERVFHPRCARVPSFTFRLSRLSSFFDRLRQKDKSAEARPLHRGSPRAPPSSLHVVVAPPPVMGEVHENWGWNVGLGINLMVSFRCLTFGFERGVERGLSE